MAQTLDTMNAKYDGKCKVDPTTHRWFAGYPIYYKKVNGLSIVCSNRDCFEKQLLIAQNPITTTPPSPRQETIKSESTFESPYTRIFDELWPQAESIAKKIVVDINDKKELKIVTLAIYKTFVTLLAARRG